MLTAPCLETTPAETQNCLCRACSVTARPTTLLVIVSPNPVILALTKLSCPTSKSAQRESSCVQAAPDSILAALSRRCALKLLRHFREDRSSALDDCKGTRGGATKSVIRMQGNREREERVESVRPLASH